MKVSKQLCDEISRILNADLSPSSEIPTYCNFNNFRSFKELTLNRPTTNGINNFFSFRETTLPTKTLNMGTFSLLETEVTSVVNQLIKQGFVVASIGNSDLFTRPRITHVSYQVIEEPIVSAGKLRMIVNTLSYVERSLPEPKTKPQTKQLCDLFAKIINTPVHAFFGDTCVAIAVRNLIVRYGGQTIDSGAVQQINFSFESMDRQGNALCIGFVPLLQNEVRPFLNAIRQVGGMIDSSLSYYWFTTPLIYQFSYTTIMNPITFAFRSRNALKVLKR